MCRFYADDDEDIGPLGDSVTTPQLRWSQRVTSARDKRSKMWTINWGITVDSGAADHVILVGWIAFLVTMVSAGSLRGLHCVAANGLRIPNEGQQLFNLLSKEGVIAALTFQMAKVNKPLASVAKLIDDDDRAVFDKTGLFYIEQEGWFHDAASARARGFCPRRVHRPGPGQTEAFRPQ